MKTLITKSTHTAPYFFFLSLEHLGQNHFPLGLLVSPTQVKWNHSIGHWKAKKYRRQLSHHTSWHRSLSPPHITKAGTTIRRKGKGLHQGCRSQSFLHRRPDDKGSMLARSGPQACQGHPKGERCWSTEAVEPLLAYGRKGSMNQQKGMDKAPIDTRQGSSCCKGMLITMATTTTRFGNMDSH